MTCTQQGKPPATTPGGTFSEAQGGAVGTARGLSRDPPPGHQVRPRRGPLEAHHQQLLQKQTEPGHRVRAGTTGIAHVPGTSGKKPQAGGQQRDLPRAGGRVAGGKVRRSAPKVQDVNRNLDALQPTVWTKAHRPSSLRRSVSVVRKHGPPADSVCSRAPAKRDL